MSSPIVIASPSGDLTMQLLIVDGTPRWRVERAGTPVIVDSTLGVTCDAAAFVDAVSLADAGSDAVQDFAFAKPAGKRRAAAARATTRTVLLTNGEHHIAVEVAVFDDAVAHRFRQLDPLGEIVDETTIDLAGDVTKFVQAYDRVSLVQPASEALYSGPVPAGFTFPVPEGWSLPALFQTAGGWALVTQTGVDGTTDGLRLVNAPGSTTHRLTRPPADQFDGPIVEAPSGPIATPWTVIVTTAELAGVVESDAIELLAPPTTLTDTSWVRPGRVTWSWWSDSDSPRNPDTLRSFIDFAAEIGWEYSLIDANWNLMPEGTVESLVAYGAERNVGIFLWYNSGGPHNGVTEQPRDRMHLRERRREEMAWLRDLGVAGLKVDFFQSDRASMNRMALEMLEDAAEFELMMNFHGITSPKGWHATWPHLLTTEGVRGAEQYKFDPWFPLTAPSLNTMLAFTRNVVGPMDYTPMTLSDVDFPHRTTNAHELALGIVFESGLQHPADEPDAYRALGEPGLDFLRRMPAVWDGVRLLDGLPGSHAVFARRHGDEWWVAGINGTEHPRSVTVDLASLGAGRWRLGRDTDDARVVGFEEVESGELAVEMAVAGGFFAWPAG